VTLGFRKAEGRFPPVGILTVPLVVSALCLAGALLALAWVNREAGTSVSPCPFRWATGQPCFLCGGTRAAFALARGEGGIALRTNPLVAVGLPLVLLLGVLRVAFGLAPVMRGVSRRALWLGAGAVVLANWVWVWMTLPR
jgi:hypothetical protein